MQTFFGSESFSKLRINREFEKLSVSLFFLRVPLRSSSHLVEAFYYCHLSFLCFRFAALGSDHIFLADLQTGPSNQSIRPHQTKSDLRSDNNRPSSDLTTINQTIRTGLHRHARQPNQITSPDHRPPSLTNQLPISTEYPTSWTGTGQVHSLWVGSRGVYRALDEPCKAYFPHTFGLKTAEFFFRLNLIVVRLVSGVPRAGKGLPCPFS